MKITKEMRREVITATGLCLTPECSAHDTIVENIWKYKEEAYESGYGHGRLDPRNPWPS